MWDLIVSVPDHCLSFYFRCDVCSKCAHDKLNYYRSVGYSRFSPALRDNLLIEINSVNICIPSSPFHIKQFIVNHPAGTPLPISSAACNVTARFGERVYKGAPCCVHIFINRGQKIIV